MENYIVINGKKAELTEEQLKALGIEIEKRDPFKLEEDKYFYINAIGKVIGDYYSNGCISTKERHDVANYCANRNIMEQRALHETLNRLLWRYSMRHGLDEIDWSDDEKSKYRIYYNAFNNSWEVDENAFFITEGAIYFLTEEAAKSAIKEIVIPFITKHPDFKMVSDA